MNLTSYSQQGRKESDMTELTQHARMHEVSGKIVKNQTNNKQRFKGGGRCERYKGKCDEKVHTAVFLSTISALFGKFDDGGNFLVLFMIKSSLKR